MLNSMKRLSDSEAASIRPRVIDVVTVKQGDTVASLANRMAYSDLKTERFLTLNALEAGRALRPGEKVKLRSEEHTSELQSLMRISYAVLRLKKKIKIQNINNKI